MRPFAIGVLLLAIGAANTSADRLHLETGGQIETARWWFDGDKLFYESSAGTVGIPRSMLVRVEKTDTSPPRPERLKPLVRSTAGSEQERIQNVTKWLENGRHALEQGDYESASNEFFKALTAAPKSYAARVQYAFCELQLGQDGSALAVVLDGLVLHPSGAELHELLGDIKDREEQLEDALRSWRKAQKLAPNERIENKIEKGGRDLRSRRNYEFARTTHFNLRYDGEVDAALAAEVSEHLEDQFWELTKRYRHTPRQPITTLLYPNQTFREVTQAAEWVGGLYDGKIRVPLGGLNRLHRGARAVLTHELTHAVVHSKSHGRAPRWLHEGLAQHSEGRVLDASQRGEVRERLAAVERPEEWEAPGFSYPVALSLVLWLDERRGFAQLVWLLDLLGEGQDLERALIRVYGDDYANLCAQWARDRNAES